MVPATATIATNAPTTCTPAAPELGCDVTATAVVADASEDDGRAVIVTWDVLVERGAAAVVVGALVETLDWLAAAIGVDAVAAAGAAAVAAAGVVVVAAAVAAAGVAAAAVAAAAAVV